MLINDVGFDDQKNDVGDIITCKKRLKEINRMHLIYVDDLLIAESIKLKEQLVKIPPQSRTFPTNFHSRTGHHLPEEKSEVLGQLVKTIEYAKDNQMQLNLKKTKLMMFNPSKSWDFMPHFSIDGNELELVEET